MTEYIDVVDENDNVVSTTTRVEIRKKCLLHRGTFVLVFNSKNEILIHKRSMIKDIYAGLHDLGNGGAVESGESYEESARREIEEEIGAKDFKLIPLFKHRTTTNNDPCFIQVFKTVYDGPITFQKEEIESGNFVTIKELKDLENKEEFCPDAFVIFKRFMEEYYEG